MTEGVVSRSDKKLSTFEFGRQNIAGCCKQEFFSVQYKSDPKQKVCD